MNRNLKPMFAIFSATLMLIGNSPRVPDPDFGLDVECHMTAPKLRAYPLHIRILPENEYHYWSFITADKAFGIPTGRRPDLGAWGAFKPELKVKASGKEYIYQLLPDDLNEDDVPKTGRIRVSSVPKEMWREGVTLAVGYCQIKKTGVNSI
jgi:hypothetical protein